MVARFAHEKISFLALSWKQCRFLQLSNKIVIRGPEATIEVGDKSTSTANRILANHSTVYEVRATTCSAVLFNLWEGPP